MKKLKLLNKWSFMYLFFGIIIAITMAIIPISLKYTIEAIQNNKSILIPLLVFVLLAILIVFVDIFNSFTEKKIAMEYEFNLKGIILRHYSSKTFKSFNESNFENHFLFDASKIISNYMLSKIKIILYSIWTIIFTSLISYISLIMLPIVISLNLLTIFINRFLEKKSSKLNIIYSENRTDYMSSIENILMGYNDAKSIGVVQNLMPIFSKKHSEYEYKNKKLIKIESWISGIVKLLSITTSLGILISLSLLTDSGIILASTFLVFISINASFLESANEFISSLYLIKSSKGLIEKVFKKIDFQESEKLRNVFPIKTKKLAFNNKNKIINFKNITIEKGDKIILKGKNGSGKSVFLKCLLDRIDHNGFATFNGKKLNTAGISHFSKYISTNPYILNCSIEKNILLDQSANLNNSFKENYAFLFKELPDLEKNSLKLSYGQKQIVCLLRALYKEPKLLIIDEAISGVAKKVLVKIEIMLSNLSFSVIYISHQSQTQFQFNKLFLIGENE